jgi:phosphonate transport system ATP-binding protein
MSFALENIRYSYGTALALKDLNLNVAVGEQIAIVGPSGGGKSTLLKLTTRAIQPQQGRVCINGVDLATLTDAQLRRHRTSIGYVHQQLAMVPNLRVAANLAAARLGTTGFWGGLRRVVFPTKPELAAMSQLLARVGMAEHLTRRLDRLSGGQQQRVAIARALWQHPSMLIADEPVSSLDPTRAADVLALLTQLAKQDSLTLMVSLHQLDLARQFFPRLIGLREGVIQFDKPSADVGAAEFQQLFALGSTAE